MSWHHWLLLAVAYAGLGLLFGCGGTSGSGGTSATPATPKSIYFDGDRNGNLRNPTGNGDNHAHGQLGPVSRHPFDDALRIRREVQASLAGTVMKRRKKPKFPFSDSGSQIDFVGMRL